MTDDSGLLLAEYSNCAELANHIDNVRNVVTSFFLTLNGGVLIVLSLVADGDVQQDTFGSPKALLAGVMLTVCALGMLFTATVARLRRVQTERYRIANGILDHLLAAETRQVISLANSSLSVDAGGSGLGKRATGSYLWTLAIMLPTAGLAGLAGYYIAADIHGTIRGLLSWLVGLALAVIILAIEDAVYFRLSTLELPPSSNRPATTGRE